MPRKKTDGREAVHEAEGEPAGARRPSVSSARTESGREGGKDAPAAPDAGLSEPNHPQRDPDPPRPPADPAPRRSTPRALERDGERLREEEDPGAVALEERERGVGRGVERREGEVVRGGKGEGRGGGRKGVACRDERCKGRARVSVGRARGARGRGRRRAHLASASTRSAQRRRRRRQTGPPSWARLLDERGERRGGTRPR